VEAIREVSAGTVTSLKPPVVDYGRTVVVPAAADVRGVSVKWRDQKWPILNWHLQASQRLKKDVYYYLESPEPGLRYRCEFVASGFVEIGGRLTMRANGTLFWCMGAATVRFRRDGGRIWRLYRRLEAPMLGQLVTRLMSYDRAVPALEVYSRVPSVHDADVVLVRDATDTAHGVSKYVGSRKCEVGETRLRLSVTSGFGSMPGCLRVEAAGLQGVFYEGVDVKAAEGKVQLVLSSFQDVCGVAVSRRATVYFTIVSVDTDRTESPVTPREGFRVDRALAFG